MWLLLALTSHLAAAWYFRPNRPWLLWAASAINLVTTFLWLGGSLGEAELRRPIEVNP